MCKMPIHRVDVEMIQSFGNDIYNLLVALEEKSGDLCTHRPLLVFLRLF